MKITMIGTGYVGLVTGTCLAEFGHHVTCVDKIESKIKNLGNGVVPIYEKGLNDLLAKNVTEGRLSFTTDTAQAVSEADAIFIAVGTPTSRRGDGYADLDYVWAAAREIAPHLTGYTVIIDKSTVPVGTARQVERIIRQVNPGADFDVVSNPEFLREGAAIEDFMRPDRVVYGSESERAKDVMGEIYKPLFLNETPSVVTNLETAELTKYAANAFLAVKISFINEIANLCEEVGADIQKLAKGIGMDGRIGSKFLHPGPGYGGSCFPKDTKALVSTANEHGSPLRIVESAVEVNNSQKARMIKKIREALDGAPIGAIAILGLTFKPETDDMKESPSLTIVPALTEKGCLIKVHDPKGMDEARKHFEGSVYYAHSAYDACDGADVMVIMTEWNQYRALDWKEIKQRMNGENPVIVDLRNVYFGEKDQEELRTLGFRYSGVGRKITSVRKND